MVPLRSVFRNRWWTLAWAAGMLWMAVDFAGGRGGADEANAADDTAAAVNALMGS